MSAEYGIAYASDLGGDEIESGVYVEVTDEWDDGAHISEAGAYYRREDGGPWVRVNPEPHVSEGEEQ